MHSRKISRKNQKDYQVTSKINIRNKIVLSIAELKIKRRL
jgi:hypothetical protein